MVVKFFRQTDNSPSSRISTTNSLRNQVGYFARACLRPEPPGLMLDALMRLCRESWKETARLGHYTRSPSTNMDGVAMREVLQVALHHGQYAFFEEVAMHHNGLLPHDFFAWARKWIDEEGSNIDARFSAIQKG